MNKALKNVEIICEMCLSLIPFIINNNLATKVVPLIRSA